MDAKSEYFQRFIGNMIVNHITRFTRDSRDYLLSRDYVLEDHKQLKDLEIEEYFRDWSDPRRSFINVLMGSNGKNNDI